MSYPYASVQDVINRFKPITSMIGSGETDVTSSDIASVFVYGAQGIVDGYLGAKYLIPIDPVPPLITQVTADLALHSIFAEKSAQVPEWMDKRYERCMDILQNLRDGKMVLPSSVGVVTGGDQEAYSRGQGYHGIFSPVIDELDQAPDIDRVEADLNDRVDDPGVQSDLCL